jgi:exonuclease VII large subunit
MKKDDLTQVKNIGSARMKLLNSQGITTIQQLYEIPLENLEQVKSLGKHYAKLIKDAVNDFYAEKAEPPKNPATEVSQSKDEKTDKIDKNLNSELAKVTKYLKTAKEKLKPMDKKKYVHLYIDFKKSSKTLKAHLNRLDKNPGKLSQKATKNIIKSANSLSTTLKNVGKKPKKKKYQKVSQEIQSFSKMLKKTSI